MKFKLIFISLTLFILGSAAIYFMLSKSYQLSLESKVYYYMGDFPKALKLSKKAYEDDHYNRMAATVMTQSQLSLEYIDYINDAKEYKKKIQELSKKEYLEKSDKVRIKFMSAIIIERFEKLTPTIMINEGLKEEAKQTYEAFKVIHDKITDAL